MQITILGATGRTGRILVEKALQEDHTVIALVRDPGRLPSRHRGLTVVRGDIHDPAAVARAVSGSAAVISVLGQVPGGPRDVLTTAARNITTAMMANGVRRLIFVAGAGVRHPKDPQSLGAVIFIPLWKLFAPQVLADAEQAAQIVMQAELDWPRACAPPWGSTAARTLPCGIPPTGLQIALPGGPG